MHVQESLDCFLNKKKQNLEFILVLVGFYNKEYINILRLY